jgi:hypothetical protein
MFNWFKKESNSGPDFSKIDSRGKAEELFRRGELEKLLLMPPDFGGEDNPVNVVYVPIGIGAVKNRIDKNVIAPLAADGKITHYSATPEYQGKSFIPVAINIAATDPGDFSETIYIWGNALKRKS